MESARIISGSTGSFMDPPTYPTHYYAVETELERRPENRGTMSLDYAAECDYIDPAIRERAAEMLQAWHDAPPLIDQRNIQLWIRRTFAYFGNCWRNPEAADREWHAGKVIISKDLTGPADDYAPIHWVRKYFPDFAKGATTAAEIASLYSAVCTACGHHINAHANGDGGKCTVITGEVHKRGDTSPYDPSELCGCPSYIA